MKQRIHSVGAPTRSAAERAARPVRRAFTRAGWTLAEELWLAGVRPGSQRERLAIVRSGDGGTLRLVFTHDDNTAPLPVVRGGITALPGLRVAAAALGFLLLVGLVLLMGGPAAR